MMQSFMRVMSKKKVVKANGKEKKNENGIYVIAFLCLLPMWTFFFFYDRHAWANGGYEVVGVCVERYYNRGQKIAYEYVIDGNVCKGTGGVSSKFGHSIQVGDSVLVLVARNNKTQSKLASLGPYKVVGR
jgi:hypothetical protein